MDSFGSNIRVFRVQTCTDTSIGTSHLGDVDRSNVSSISQTSREKEGEKGERQRETETEGESASEEARRNRRRGVRQEPGESRDIPAVRIHGAL